MKVSMNNRFFKAISIGSAVMAFTAILLAGCSSGSSVSGSVVLYSTASLDGDITGTAVSTDEETVDAGDNDSDNTSRGFFSFDVSGIAPDSTDEFEVASVILKLTMTDWFDADGDSDPIADMGNVVVELVEYGTSLDSGDMSVAADYGSVTLASDFGMIVDFEANVTQMVQNYIDSGDTDSLDRWQFRIRHIKPTDSDGTSDITRWAASEYDGTDYDPSLTVSVE